MKLNEWLDVERALVVYAHPDDAEFGFAGTAAKWAREGVEVVYCMATNGASGSSDPEMTRERLAEIRRAEQLEAARILGVKECVFLGFEDGYLYPDLDVRRSVARQIRIWRPDVVITQDPTQRLIASVYVNHPDHIAIGEVVLRSINPDASTRLMFPELWHEERLEPHKPKACLLMAFLEGDFFVDITDTMDLKVKALQIHESQIGDWPAEDFIRARNREIGERSGVEYAEGYRFIAVGG